MDDRFGDIAVGAGFISRAQLEEALAIQRFSVDHVPLGRLLYDLTYLSLGDVTEVLAKQRALRRDADSPAPRIGPEPVSPSGFGRDLEKA